MRDTIKLNDHVKIDLQKLVESRLLVQANSGGGKSWAIRRIIEQAFGNVQIIVIDPEGEFGNMRGTYDFVYAGKGGDAPVESRSAALLARRLLELKASAIVDLYELQPQERKRFVKLFCEAMVNAPKELWHDVLVIIDEAHVFAPEKGESEAMGPVIDLATRGRKRGYCVVLATQRLPKLNKDAAAECNNKLIGRASQDIDRKRAAEELGFTGKEQILSLRDLNPGEFYAFGPAIGRNVQLVTIGEVIVKPAKRGVVRSGVPAPSAHVKSMLAKLADLPQEAAKEARTVAELLQQVKTLTHQLKTRPVEKVEQVMGVSQWREYGKKYGYYDFFGKKIVEDRDKEWKKALSNVAPPPSINSFDGLTTGVLTEAAVKNLITKLPKIHTESILVPQEMVDILAPLGRGEQMILRALIQHYPDGMTREHITVQTGYKRSTRDAYIQRLQAKGYVQVLDKVYATQAGIEASGPVELLPTGPELVEYHLKNLPEGESLVLKTILSQGGTATRDEITEFTGYKRSTRDAYIQRLSTRQLVSSESGGVVRASAHLHS